MKKFMTILLFIAFALGVGCEHRIGKKISDFKLGKGKLIDEDVPVEAIQFLEKTLKREPNNVEARCYLVIAYKRAATYGSENEYVQGQQREFKKIKNIGDPAVEKLTIFVRDRDRIHKDVMEVLVDFGGVAVPKLIDMLVEYPRYRTEVIDMLTRIGAPAVGGLSSALDSKRLSTSAQMEIIQILGDINDSGAILALQKQLNSADHGVKMEAALALYKLGEEKYASQIIAGLKDPDVNARRAAARGLIGMNESPTDEMIKVLKDSDGQVRFFAAKALCKHPDRKAIKTLIQVLKKSDRQLFRVGLKFQSDLDKNNISGDLRREFKNKEFPLSLNTALSIEKEGSSWLITDRDNSQMYMVRKEADKLNIYSSYSEAQNAAAEALSICGKDIAKRLITELKGITDWKIRIRIANVLKNDEVIKGIDEEAAYQLDQEYRKETHKMVKTELGNVLIKLESK